MCVIVQAGNITCNILDDCCVEEGFNFNVIATDR